MASKPPLPNGSRLRQIGWAAALGICLTFFLALTFHVNAVKSEVRLAERQIIALERQKMMLETEFQTRASQRQLAAWNAVEFGYVAPRASQYLEGRRQLAKLGSPPAPGAPQPIRVAMAPPPVEQPGMFDGWSNPLASVARAGEIVNLRADTGGAARETALAEGLEATSTDLAQRLTRTTSIGSMHQESGQ